MKTLKKLTGSLLSIFILFAVLLSTLSCEIGLGASVDTDPPSLSIDKGIADKVVRGDFALCGTWADDGTIDKLSAVLKRTDGTGSSLTFTGTLKETPGKRGAGTWTINIPAKTNSITDGTYQADITIKDATARTTVQSTIFTIDNTAPVIVLTRPTNNDTYGQKFTIEGQAADTNNIDRIEIQLFKDAECTQPAGEAPIVLKQVPLSISMDAASYESADENYIYEGEAADGKTKQFSISVPKDGNGSSFYCKIYAYDGSSRYLGEDDTPADDDDKGNKVDYFYLYKDIYTPILQYYKITELYSILNNTYKEEAARAVTAVNVKADLLDASKYQKKTSYFTLNPKNNPTFTVTGKSPLALDGKDFTGSANEILNGQSVFIEVSPGLDDIPLDEASLKIYVQECDANGKIKTGAQKIYPPATKEEKGTSYRFNVKLSRSEDNSGLKINSCYIFGVEGHDQSDAKNQIEPAGRAYGFRLAASGNAPKLTVTQPASATAYVKKDGKQTFTGNIELEMGVPKLLVYKESDNTTPVKEIEFNEADGIKDASSDSYKYNFSFDYGEFGTEGIHNFIFKADLGGQLSQPIEKTIVYDVKVPTIEISSVDPKEEDILKFDLTKEDGTTIDGHYVNGTMKFTVSIVDDDAVDKAWYKINSGTLQPISTPVRYVISDNTKAYPDNSTFTLTIIAMDRAGNESSLVKTYTIDQSTDKPVILPGDSDTISFKLASKSAFDSQQAGRRKGIASTSSPVSIKLHDDDGIASLVVKRSQKITSDSEALTWTTETITNISQPSFRMPDDGGLYKFEIIATDIHGTQTSTGVFVLSAARDAATITEIRTTPTYRKGEAGQTFENEIIGINSQGPYKLYRKIEGKDTDFVEVTSGYDQLSQLPIKDTIDVGILLSNGNPISNPVDVYYYVEDSTPRDSNKNVKASLGIDNEPPAIEIKSPITGKTGTSALNEKTQFSGRASDTKSGVSKIWYKFTDSDSAGSETGTAGGYTGTDAANGPFAIDVDFISGTTPQTGKLEEGSWYFHVYAEDEAGNKSAVASRAFDIDLSTPELEVTIPNTATCKQANGIYYFAGDFKGTIKDSDTAGPVSIDFKLAGTSVAHTISSVENADGSFNWTVASSVFTESTQQNLKIIATDKFGKTKEVSYNVYKDNTAPNLTAINPGSVNTTTKTITGSVNDGTGAGVSVVKWSTSANGTYTNAGTSDQSSWSNEFTFAGEGTQNYYFKAVDILGNTSETPVHISFEYDLNNPEIRSTDTYSTTNATYTKNSFTLTGKAWDTNKLAATGGVVIEENGSPVTGITIGDISNATSEADAAIWSKTFDLTDGSYTYKMFAKDAANRQSTPITKTIVVDKTPPAITITETNADLYINTNNHQFNGTITESNLNTLEAKLIKNEDTANPVKTQTIYPANGEWSWTVTGLTDAEYTIQLSATDKAGNSGSAESTKKVIVDTQSPVISLKSDGNLFDVNGNAVTANTALSRDSTYYAKTAFVLKGSFTESNFASATIKNGSEGLSFTSGGSEAGDWTYSQANTDGTYVYNISVTDNANNSASYSVTVIIDKAAPTTNTITAPVEGRTGENSLTDTTYIFKGNAADGTGETGLAKLWYKFSNSATAPEGTSGYDSMAASDGSWSLVKTINSGTSASATGNLYEGKWYLHVKAQDKAGNVSATAATRAFDIDMASPVITTKLDGTELTESSEQKKNAAYTFSFKITETNPASGNLATITVKKGKNDLAASAYKIKQDSTEKTLAQLVAGTEYTIEIPSAADAVYTYDISVTDAVGKSSSVTRVVRLDTTAPVIAVSTPDFTGWQSSNNFNVIGTASDASGTKAVYYALNPAGGTAPAIPSKENSLTPSSWTGWTAANGSDSWNISLTNVANGDSNKLFLAAVDILGNVTTTAVEKTVKVDATEPDISDFKYAIGSAVSSPIINTVYLNRKEGNTLTIYGKYEEDLSLVDLTRLSFAVSGASVSPTLTFYSDSGYANQINTSTTSMTETAYWKAVFSKDVAAGTLTVTGYNGAGALKSVSICTINVDTDDPTATNIKLSDSYLPDGGTSYFINNSNKFFTISGSAADDTSAIKSVTLSITNTAVAADYDSGTKPADITNITNSGTLTGWKFENIDIKSWKKGAVATVTITDLAGNTKQVTLNAVFDVTAPVTVHKIDDSLKNLEFRIGDYANDAGESDVGGKYSDGTYGSALTMQIRGNFPDEEDGSGINKFYYKTFNNQEVVIDATKATTSTPVAGTGDDDGKLFFKDLDSLKAYVIANKTDIFSPLSAVETKNVEYNITPGGSPATAQNTIGRFGGTTVNGYTVNSKGYVQFRTSVTSNFKTTIKGFQEGKNFLVIVAEDNVGNTAVDSAVVNGVTYPCYSLNVDITAPTIPTKPEGTKFTNLKETNGVIISGTVSDKPNVANGSSGLKKIIFTRDGGTGSVEVTTFTAPTDDDRIAATAVSSDYSTDTTLKHWDADVSSLLPTSGMAIISAKVIDNAGFETSIPVATITVDKAGPVLKVNSPDKNEKVKYEFTISGTADDGNGAGIDTAEGMTLYYTKSTTLGGVTSAPESITAGTDPASSWVAYTTAPELTDSDWTVDFNVPESVAADSANTDVYYIVSAKDKSGTGNVSYTVPRKITVDRVKPAYNPDYAQLSIGGKTHSEMTAATTPWFKDDTLVVKGQFTDAGGSGVTKIFYQVDSESVVELATKDGTYNTNISGFGANSTLKLWAEDAVGNNTSAVPVTYTVKVDKVAPSLTETGVGTTGKTTNTTITLKGKAWDTNELDRIEISDGTTTWKSTDTGSNITLTKSQTEPTGNTTNWSASFVVGSGNSSAANYIADGTKEFTITAYDVAGQSKQLARSVVVDTILPTCGTLSITSTGNTVGTGADEKTWYKSSFINIQLPDVEDAGGTGIQKVEYTIDGTNWYQMSGSGTTYTATANCTAQGQNTISVKVTDVAGNVKSAGTLTAYVDTKEPSLETSKVKYRNGNFEAVSELLINGSNGYELQIDAADTEGGAAANNSGIASVTYFYKNESNNIQVTAPDANGHWNIPVPITNGTDKYDSSKTNAIYAIIKDNAGNEVKERILTVTKDTTDPNVEIVSFTRAGSTTTVGSETLDNVNGTITISGTASDTNKFGNVKLEYQKAGTDTWTEITTSTDNSWTTTLNTKTLTDDKKYTIRATATDAAGNTATDTQVVYVNQDSDRPVITVTNMIFATVTEDGVTSYAANETSYLKRTSRLEGTVSDDDGNVSKFEYSKNGTSWDEIDLEYGTAWSITDLPEGENKIYFRVTDKVNTTPFTTAVEVETATTEAANQPKIKDSSESNTYVTHTKGSLALKFKVVTKQPEVEGKQYQVYNSSTSAWENRENLGTLGGVYTKFKISLKAKSDAFIGSVKAKYAADDYNISFTTTETTTNNTYHTWTSPEIDFDSSKTEIKLKISDASSTTDPMTLEQTVTYSVDNTAPTIRIKDPSSTAGVKETMQFDLSEAATSSYAVTRKTVTADATTGAPSTEPIWTDILDTSNGLTRYVFFDNESTETDKTERFALYLTETSTNPKHLGITTLEEIERATNPYEEITPVKFWVKAVDSCGNIGYASTIVNVDPQGNRPTVTLNSPKDVEKEKENGVLELVPPTLGGTIRLDGNVADDKGAKFVWIQLARSWTETNNGTTTNVSKPFNAEALQYFVLKGYTIGNMNDNTDVAAATIDALDANADVSDYAIKVPVTGNSWNLSINGNQEFNQAAEVDIAFTIYATDEDKDEENVPHIHRSAPVTQSIKIDSRTPYINTSELYLVKYNGNTEVARKAYKEGEDVDGIWYLQGMIRDDDSGLKTVEYKKNGAEDYTGAITASVGNVDSVDGDTHFYFKKVPHSDDANKFDYSFSVPLGSSTANQVGTDAIQIHAVENTTQNLETSPTFRVTYDNKAPVFNTDTNNAFVKLSQEVYNSSGFYTFGAIASEDKVNNVDQSGVERIAFYFTRDLDYSLSNLPDGANYSSHTGELNSKTNDLFDVMIYRSGQDGADVTSGNMIVNYKGKAASSTLKFSEGLYWRTHAGTSDGKTFTYTGDADPNIHAGGLVKINGVIYKIKSVSGQIITVDNDITGTSADFALCNVIDNGGEKNGSSTSSSHGYGFGYYGTRVTDDGDLITETFNNQGTEWIFDASINSKNLPDGPITLHMVAFDKAGNVTTTPYTMDGTVKNNAPRIAGLILGTDENGNGSVDSDEFVNAYSGKYSKGYDTAGNEMHDVSFPVTPTGEAQKSLLTVKGLTVIKPEIVGGNGAISYKYKVKTGDTWGTEVSGGALAKNGGGTVSGTTDDVVTGSITLPVSAFIGTTNGADGNVIPDGDLSEFKFTFGDSTPGTSLDDTAGKNSASMSVILDVALRETTKAKNWILPFYWKDEDNSSLFRQTVTQNGKQTLETKGHIELATDWIQATGFNASNEKYDADPKVSGMIKLEGIARDDTLLREIKVKLGTAMTTTGGIGTTDETATTIASYDAANGSWSTTALATTTTTVGQVTTTTISIPADTGWASAIQQATYQDLKDVGIISAIPDDKEATSKVPYTSQDYGHVVHWILYLNTEKVNGVAATDVKVTATATDRGKPKWNSTTGAPAYTANDVAVTGDTTDDEGNPVDATNSGAVSDNGAVAALSGRYRMDVVPYITKLYTGISDTAGEEFARSATGKYIVRGKYRKKNTDGTWTNDATEPVRLFGFNLTADSTTGNVVIGSTDKIKTTASSDADTEKFGAHLTFPVGTGTSSGKLSITVNSITSLNNINASPEIEDGATEPTEGSSAMYNSQANGITNNRLTDDVELVVWDMNYFLNEVDITSPMLKMDKTGNYYMSYGHSTKEMWVNKNGTTEAVDQSYNKFHNTNVTFDDNGNLYAVAMNTDRIGDSSSRFVFYVPYNSQLPENGQDGDHTYSQNSNSRRHLELAYNSATTIYNVNRVKMSKLITYTPEDSADSYIAMSYYDGNNTINPVKFRYGKRAAGGYTADSDTEIIFTYKTNIQTSRWDSNGKGWTISGNTNLNGKYVLLTDGNYYSLTRNRDYNNNYYYTIASYNGASSFNSKTYSYVNATFDGGISGSITSRYNANITAELTVDTSQSNDPSKTDSSYKDYHIIASDSTTKKGGQYTAVGIVPVTADDDTTTNVGVAAWYDANARRVCYSYNEDLGTPVVGGAWQDNAIYLDEQYTGWYVDLAVDDAGHIHIAYYNSAKGDLKYVYLDSYDAQPSEPIIIDSYLSVGTNITVNVRKQGNDCVPYIYYYNTSANQTPNTIKVAWRKDMETLRDGAVGDKFTGAWECMTIPSINIPVDATVCGGVPTGVETNATDYSKSVVLGYMTDQFFEKAYIKGDITSANW